MSPKPKSRSIQNKPSLQGQPIYYKVIELFIWSVLFPDTWLHLAWNYWLKSEPKKNLDGIRVSRNREAFYKHI